MGLEISMMGNWVEIQKQAMMPRIISTKASSLGPYWCPDRRSIALGKVKPLHPWGLSQNRPICCASDNLHVWNGFGYLGGDLNCRKMICLEHLQWWFLLLISSTHCDVVTRLVFGECFESWPMLLGSSLKFQRTASFGYVVFRNKFELMLFGMFWLVFSLGCSMYKTIWFEHYLNLSIANIGTIILASEALKNNYFLNSEQLCHMHLFGYMSLLSPYYIIS
jgi:hypothetical protein